MVIHCVMLNLFQHPTNGCKDLLEEVLGQIVKSPAVGEPAVRAVMQFGIKHYKLFRKAVVKFFKQGTLFLKMQKHAFERKIVFT